MPNEEYQRLLRESAASLRERIPGSGHGRREIELLLADVDDDALRAAIRDLGDHDLGLLLEAFAAADSVTDRPTVIFAYTIKAWSLPTEGHPGNHSALLTQEQWVTLGHDLGADPEDPWAGFAEETLERNLCRQAANRLERSPVSAVETPEVPVDLGLSHRNASSTQQAFGRFLGDLRRAAPNAAARVVTVSPDVASSTNLGSWITALARGRSANGSTGSPTIRTHSSGGASTRTGSTSSSASQRSI